MATLTETITQLPTGTVKGTDATIGVDVLNFSLDSTGLTSQYPRWAVYNYFLSAMGVYTYAACVVGTTGVNLSATYSNGVSGVGATLTNSGTNTAFTLDGLVVPLGSRVLVKDQSNEIQNGIYVLTVTGNTNIPWVLTRSNDFNTPSSIVQFGAVLITEGTTNSGKTYQQIAPPPFVIGTTDIVFDLFSFGNSIALIEWIDITSAAFNMIAGEYYMADASVRVVFTLPTTASEGTELKVIGGAAGNGWMIVQNASQQIIFGDQQTTLGNTGFLESTNANDSISLVCTTGSLVWKVFASIGNITYF